MELPNKRLLLLGSFAPHFLRFPRWDGSFYQSAIKVMRPYFTDRVNRTRVSQTVSSWREIDRGCLQGSALLGPMRWNIYQNDLFYIQLKSQLSAYADDHQLYLTHEEPEQAVKGIINDETNLKVVK